MSQGNRGQIRVIEAFLAMIVIFSAFAVSADLAVTRRQTRNDDLHSTGLQMLMSLDSDGLLGRLIADENWTALRETIALTLQPGVWFNMTVYDSRMRQVNDMFVSNGGLGGQNVAFVEYVCSGRGSTFHCYIIYLSLAIAI